MRLKKCIKYLLFSITPLLCCVFFSSDTKAATLDLGAYDIVQTNGAVQMLPCYASGCSSWGDATWNVKIPQADLYSVKTSRTYDMKKGDLFEYMVEIRQDFNPLVANQYSRLQTSVGLLNGPGLNSVQYLDVFESSYDYNYSLTFNCSTINPNGFCGQYSAISADTGYTYKVFQVLAYVFSDGVRPLQMGDGSSFSLRFHWADWSVPDSSHRLNLRILNVSQYRLKDNPAEEMNDKDDEDRDNLEQQSSEIDSDSSSSAEDASEQGTTLLGAFTAFVNALTNASPSNCRLLMNIGRFEAGQVDLCTLDPPAGFSAIASIFLILFCVPLSIATARKVISLFRSFQ